MFSPRYLYLLPGLVFLLIGLIGAGVLYHGPWQVSNGITLDVHSYVFFVFLSVLGAQFLLFGVLSRSIASTFNIKRDANAFQRRFSQAVSLESLLVLALVLLLGGVIGAWSCFAGWQHAHFSNWSMASSSNPFIASMAAILTSAQIMASAFFASSILVFARHQLPR